MLLTAALLLFSLYLEAYELTVPRKIVAFLKARYPAPKVVDGEEVQAEFPEGSNAELFGHWFGNMDHFEDKHMNYEEDYCELLIFCVPTTSLLVFYFDQSLQMVWISKEEGFLTFYSRSRHIHSPRIPPERPRTPSPGPLSP